MFRWGILYEEQSNMFPLSAILNERRDTPSLLTSAQLTTLFASCLPFCLQYCLNFYNVFNVTLNPLSSTCCSSRIPIHLEGYAKKKNFMRKIEFCQLVREPSQVYPFGSLGAVLTQLDTDLDLSHVSRTTGESGLSLLHITYYIGNLQ